MINVLFSRICVLACGTLYPGYISFKTVRAKIVGEYVKWMMYWIVFAIYTATETFTDIFFTWFPFYYEAKVALILWLLPTMGNGSTYVYKKCIHPLLKKHETSVDQQLVEVRERGQELVLYYMKEAVMYITKGVMQVINRNVPNGILGVLANAASDSERIVPESNIIAKEIQEQENVETDVVPNTKLRKPNVRITTNLTDDGDAPQTTRGRARKPRQPKSEIDTNLNES